MIKTIALTLIIGMLLGGSVGYWGAKNSQTKSSDSSSSVSPLSQPKKNLYDGSSLTLAEMHESLLKATGSDFDHKLLIYEVALKQNESGMLRMAKEKSTHDSMKNHAKDQIEKNDAMVSTFYDWQKQWGYNHH